MDTKNEKKTERDEILALAENTKYYTDLLIQQSDSWLSEEEGRKNVEEKRKKEKSRRKSRFFFLPVFCHLATAGANHPNGYRKN